MLITRVHRGGRQKVVESVMRQARSWRESRMGIQIQEYRQPPEMKGKEIDSSLKPPEGTQLC